MEFDVELDARGLKCPLPILKTKKTLATMLSGQILRVLATDPKVANDFKAFSQQTGNDLISCIQQAEEFEFYFRRK